MAEFEAYIEAAAMESAQRHVRKLAADGREGMGLLLGRRCKWEGQEYAYADRFATVENDSSAVRVSFSADAFPELAALLRRKLKGRVVLAWLHSHPGYGCFLSGTDIATQENFFGEPFHFAVVCDPTREDGASMLSRAFRVEFGESYEIPFAVVERK
ncbi:MAG: Mov34/MPN/PAD-1 family protein [Candidatus Micrarchaeota archaeon]